MLLIGAMVSRCRDRCWSGGVGVSWSVEERGEEGLGWERGEEEGVAGRGGEWKMELWRDVG